MAGLVPAIYVLLVLRIQKEDVNARNKSGHDGVDHYPLIRSTVAPQRPSLSSSRSKPRSR
ncbi:MAG: hypothetical protein QOJ15_2529 [Bradyrhizobium sp.]|nr:hypothetical protein [Bradyrhizobium sp.]